MMFKHIRKAADSSSCQSVHGTCTDGVDSDALWAQIMGQISDGRLQRSLGDPHDVVVWYDFLRAIVSHGENASTFLHQGLGAAGQSYQRIGADIVSNPESVPRGIEKPPLQSFPGGKGNAMEDK